MSNKEKAYKGRCPKCGYKKMVHPRHLTKASVMEHATCPKCGTKLEKDSSIKTKVFDLVDALFSKARH
ncbi:hypothetical protein [Helicobacter sp. 11S02629-2]|uniref:hypothetical protein n=1 Tax=Helicobacter sp. 11S02629-2 TaxID=1476195 RepID=UPI000BA70397|nr:hypothetical protein [Helicobacter sp. 11S02629-2]PAF45698.1 hypothetical protein BKH40_02115 [Helicobacter sp. 11S02629-2]